MSMLLLVVSASIYAQPDLDHGFDKFSALYKQRFGQVRACLNPTTTRFSVCSPALRNDGNAPYILHHGKPTDNVVVLLHGLSDSPFYMRGIAQALFDKGMNVIVPLNVGHGQRDADDDMSDSDLAKRWKQHLDDVIKIAPEFGNKIYLGGFSTGGLWWLITICISLKILPASCYFLAHWHWIAVLKNCLAFGEYSG